MAGTLDWGVAGGIPNVGSVKVSGPFIGSGQLAVPSSATGWKPFTFRKTSTMAKLICVGGGNAGGGGFAVASGTAKGGGGGGGSGAIAIMTIPLFYIPRTIYLFGGPGGSATAGTFAGVSGNRSLISDAPNATNLANLILVSGSAAAPSGGAAGVTGGSSGGGSGETAATALLGMYMSFGELKFIAGVAGSAAGVAATPAAGVALTFGTSAMQLTGGTGGGACNLSNATSAGGAITGAGLFPTLAGGLATADGQNGRWNPHGFPFIASGGTGGGGTNGVGGRGGAGAPGCGGGGGGGGTTGGIGGAGGPGFHMIVEW